MVAQSTSAPSASREAVPPRFETHAEQTRQETFYAGLRTIDGSYDAYRRLRETDPPRCAAETEAYLERRTRYLGGYADLPLASSYARDTATATE